MIDSPRHLPTLFEELDAGERAERRADWASAQAAYRAAAAASEPRLATDAMFRLGRLAWRQGRLDDAMELYERALGAAAELRDDELRARIENGIGTVHCQRSAFTQARAAYRVAFDLTRDPSLKGRLYVNLGVLSSLLDDAPQARELYGRGIQAFESAHDDAGLALALHNLGLLHLAERESTQAASAFSRALAIAERLVDRPLTASILLNRAELACAEGQFAAALESCDRAMTLYKELDDDAGRAAAFRWRGAVHRRLHEIEDAETELKESIRIAGRLQLLMLEAEAARELGLLKATRGDGIGATKWLRRALARFSTMGAEREAAAVEEELSALKPWRPSGGQRAVPVTR